MTSPRQPRRQGWRSPSCNMRCSAVPWSRWSAPRRCTPASAETATTRLEGLAPPARAEDPGHRRRRHRHAIGHALLLQAVARFLPDHEIDQLEPLLFVDRLCQQLPVTRVVVARVLLAHRTPPYALPRKEVFPKRHSPDTELRDLSQGSERVADECCCDASSRSAEKRSPCDLDHKGRDKAGLCLPTDVR